MALSRSPGFFLLLRDFLGSDRGATAVEYGLLAGLIALVVIGALSTAFAGISNTFNFLSNAL